VTFRALGNSLPLLAAVLLTAILWWTVAAPAQATSSATLIYRGAGQGRVVFDGRAHLAKGFRCADCHTEYAGTRRQLFETRKSGRISLADHDTDTRCFACHNGKVAFAECSRCHRE
jgi:thiosulfate reductase cytochrome b subunit